MLNNGILEIIKLTNDFYFKHAESFDRSREFYWKIFEDSLNYLKNGQKILDLGCGNARYFKFLKEKNLQIDYLGLDSNQVFINENKVKYPDAKFEQLDLISSLKEISQKFDLITVFGVTHHLPSKSFREKWFQELTELSSNRGIIILSFWNFNQDKGDQNYIPKEYKIEKGDFFLGWKGDYSVHRFCHFYDEEEIQEVKKIFKDFNLLEDYCKEDNRYLIFQKK